MCCAVVFGIVAAVVFVVVYEKIESSDKPGSSAERTGIVIEKTNILMRQTAYPERLVRQGRRLMM